MKKRTPHYRLAEIQSIVADRTSRPFTATALKGGLELGLTEADMRGVVLALTNKNFYKSMTSYSNHKDWQDVYHGLTEEGVTVYIKVTFYPERPPVIQFKAK